MTIKEGARLKQLFIIQHVDHQKVSRKDRVRGPRFEGRSYAREPEEMETEREAGKPKAPGNPRRGSMGRIYVATYNS